MNDFPNTFLQSFKYKVPVISLNANPDNVLTKFNIGFCCNGEFKLMKKYLMDLLENKNLLLSYSNNAYNYFKRNHNINKKVQKWIKIFEILLKQ